MYNPPRFQSTDKNEVFNLMFHHPFATLISQTDIGPMISHLPLKPIWNGDEIELVGHLATANPHIKLLDQSKVTVIFNGPHTYVTPVWYAENDVPTWNYIVVHATGSVSVVKDSESIIECLKTLTNHVEKLWPSGWDFFIPDDLQGAVLEKSIVGFRVKIEDLNFKKKLSQNRKPEDRKGIINGLSGRIDYNSIMVLQKMQDIYLSSGELKTANEQKPNFASLGVLTNEAFDKQLEALVNNIWSLQDRLGELTEFEKQWEEVFTKLKDKAGYDCSVHIYNHNVYKTFHWDKYHIILSDLVSLIENELDARNKKSVFKQTIHHLKLSRLEDYIRHDVKVHFSFYPHREITEEEKNKEIERTKLRDANDAFAAVQESLRTLYPHIQNDFIVRDTDIQDLLTKAKGITKSLKSARILFNHKLEETAKKKHTKGLEAASLANMEIFAIKLTSFFLDQLSVR